MADNNIFKTATFGGFDKQAVLTYIDELGVKNAQKEQVLSDRVSTLSKENYAMIAKIETMEQALSELTNELNATKNELSKEDEISPKYEQELERLNTQLLEQNLKLNEYYRDIQLKDEQNRLLMERVSSSEDRTLTYEESVQQVGTVIVEAKKTADQIVDRAKDEAELILNNANEASAIIKIKAEKGLMFISDEIDEFRSDVEELRASLTQAMTSITVRLDNIVESIDSIDVRTDKMIAPFKIDILKNMAEDSNISN